MSEWAQIEEMTRLLAEALVARGVPQSACACSEAAERATDRWIRELLHGRPESLPDDPAVLRLLLARCRYATAVASQMRMLGAPLPPKSTGLLTAEIYLIGLWHAQFRAQWLAGEQGVAPSEN